MISLDSLHDSGENEVLFLEIESRVPDLRYDNLVGPVGPNVVSRPQTPMPRNFRDFMILLDSSQDFVENEVLFFKIEARFLD